MRAGTAPLPVHMELFPVQIVPFHHLPKGSLRKPDLHLARGDVDDDLVLEITSNDEVCVCPCAKLNPCEYT